MIKQVWLNLPVKDIQQSKQFFTDLGFSFAQYGNSSTSVGLVIGASNTVVMLFAEPVFESFTHQPNADTRQCSEILISFDAESKEEVDEMAARVKKAGGVVFAKPSEIQGWMYGCGFTDLDGHRWNMLYMDSSKMPGS